MLSNFNATMRKPDSNRIKKLTIQLSKESKLVRTDSLAIIKEFEDCDLLMNW